MMTRMINGTAIPAMDAGEQAGMLETQEAVLPGPSPWQCRRELQVRLCRTPSKSSLLLHGPGPVPGPASA
jgi:hypothetical protein